jgi:acetoin utilization deacetylase AcuC-like enzyme
MKTAVVSSPEFLAHDPGEHIECPPRAALVVAALEKNAALSERIVHLAPRPATDADVLRCHAAEHVARIARAHELTQARGARVALDPDTVVSEGSLRAARLGSGGALTAIDAVMAGAARNAFVVARPPGHHATPDRAMGFCLFNHIAVGARYIQAAHNLERVLIVDWDVHHGNGTQDIFYTDPSVLFYSIHQFPHYPGTGSRYEEGAGAGAGYTVNAPLPGGTSAAAHVEAFFAGLDAAVAKLRPDFVLLSAGFDAHRDDPLGDMALTDADYVAMTRRLTDIAETHCDGRLVAVLEGGYNLATLPQTVSAHVETLAAAARGERG